LPAEPDGLTPAQHAGLAAWWTAHGERMEYAQLRWLVDMEPASARAAVIAARFAAGEWLSSADVGSLTGLSIARSHALLGALAAVLPIYYDGRARCWRVLAEREADV